jgi:hypothetical protein
VLSLAAPAWLLGLALLPVIRWLHRGGRHRRSVAVSHLGLWQGAALSQPAAGERRPPDPAWRRRALLAALLFTVLAGPQWPARHPGITLWVDDSISMLTREPQGTRLALGLGQARALLAGTPHGAVQVRALGDPWQAQGTLSDAVVAGLEAGAGRQEPSPPPAALLRGDHLHWLLTDGADARLWSWPGGRRADRVIQVGVATRNVGIQRLSARRRAGDATRVDVQLKLVNGGNEAETREIVWATPAGEVARTRQRLESGAWALVSASVPAAAQVRATLQPGDALAEDDHMVLDLAPLQRRRVAVDPHCTVALAAAVASHPGLVAVPADSPDVQAALDCTTPAPARAVPVVHVRADHTPQRVAGPVLWAPSVPEATRLSFEGALPKLAAQLRPGPGEAVLLAAGGQALVVSRAGSPRRIETSLDFASDGATGGPHTPLLVNLMFERLLGEPLLDALVMLDRGPAASRVVPLPDSPAGAGGRGPGALPMAADAARPLLWLAALVLVWEIVALGQQWNRLRPVTGLGSR